MRSSSASGCARSSPSASTHTSGIGRATAERFASLGARVVASDIDAERGAAVAASLRDAVFMAADVTDATAVDDLVAFAVASYGQLDCAANCAGVGGGHAAVEGGLLSR